MNERGTGMHIHNEAELVTALQQRESSAFATLVELVGPRLVGSATRILRSRLEAEDAMQETLLAVWKGIEKFEGGSSLYTWMHRILINNCLARLRSARSDKEIAMSSQDSENIVEERTLRDGRVQLGPTLEKQIAMRRTIDKALQQIPEEFRIVLLLRDVEELSSKEAAEVIGISDSLVRQRLHRARTVMAEILRPELCSGPELTCGGQVNLLMDFIDGVISAEMFEPVDSHIASCEACARLLSAYRGTIDYPKALCDPTLNPELSAELVKRIAEQAAA